ncbi:EDD domain protein, DegV family [Sporobacter termitidis DSM 10068]|uniref:EDD domain protein, DegV family n=1 Tax=Sporobacter termitidis DSM 10068 TaxID=1123282 RepID=A0A1M5YUM8_9FIRM|nr:DegV family protein [Sporobacter termitidis]SHI15812.1 EDD domain protein, DegV family [Sporobacter termitidis DSM 10068]
MRIKITSDSTCDLTKEIVSKYDITIIPLPIIKGDVSFKDGVDITPEDIFEYVESGAGVCHTAAINVGDYQEAFRPLASEYDAVIHFTLSSGISSCLQNAQLAASEFDNIYVVDTLNLSTGSGHLVLDAAIMAQNGAAPAQIVEKINALAPKVEASFVIDTLKYLYKGGRCSGVAALGANVLKLKPCIEVVGGKMDVGKKYRGNFDKVILQYVADRLKDRDDVDYRRIFVTHPSGVPKEVCDAVIKAVRSFGPFEEIIESQAGCAISNHCGPVCLGILFYRK